MKSSLVFWDTLENSKRGTLRGLIIFPIFIIITLTWYLLMYKIYNKHIDKVSLFRLCISLVLIGLLIVSALGVHTPNTLKKAITYGLLVGLVIYGISNLVLLATSNKWGYKISIIDILWGIISTGFLSFVLYIVVQKWPKYFNVI